MIYYHSPDWKEEMSVRLKNIRAVEGKSALLMTAILWSTSGLFIKIITWHPVLIAGGRSFLAVISMLAVRLIINRGSFHAAFSSLRVSVKSPAFYITGAAYSVTMLLFVAANKLTTSANAILLQYSAPIWTAFLGWAIIKERPRAEHWFGMTGVCAGLIIFFKNSLGTGALLGDVFALISGITFGMTSVFMRMQKDQNPADSMLSANLLTALFALPFLPYYTPLNLVTTAALCFMGFAQTGLAAVLYSFGMKTTRAITAMLILSIEPILNPLWVFIVTGERPSINALFGGGIIAAAVIITTVVSGKK